MNEILQPDSWAKPSGYANGIAARGRTIYLAGQIGWDHKAVLKSDYLVDQVRQALRNIVAILAEAGAGPEHITSMTWYLTDRDEYLDNLKGIGEVYREICGRNFPTMAAVQVVSLMEKRAKVEIQAIAVVPD
jgi:enamine deaminase RidA (YjgF/YER057c/UK114 family)